MSDEPSGLRRLLDSEEEAPVTSTPAKRGKRRMRWWLVGLIGLLSVILVGGGYYIISGLLALSQIERDSTLMPSYEGRPAAPREDGPAPVNYVLMGSDSRGTDQGRSDVLMVAHLSADRSKLYLISFPRDLYVEIPGRGKNKINAAYAFGGTKLTVQTLENLLGVRMSHVVLTDFVGFIGLTEELDGVTVFNSTASTVGAYKWPRGEITIKGEEALTYVRQRHGLADGDLGRAERQRNVTKAVALKLLKPSTMANPVTFGKVMGKVGQYFKVDSELTTEVMFSTATSLKVAGSSDIVSLQAPISGFGRSPVGASIDVVNEKQMAELATAMKDDTMAAYWERYKNQEFNPNR